MDANNSANGDWCGKQRMEKNHGSIRVTHSSGLATVERSGGGKS